MRELISTRAGNESSNLPPKSSQARTKAYVRPQKSRTEALRLQVDFAATKFVTNFAATKTRDSFIAARFILSLQICLLFRRRKGEVVAAKYTFAAANLHLAASTKHYFAATNLDLWERLLIIVLTHTPLDPTKSEWADYAVQA